MKKILGLDLGTSSIGWALVNEAESSSEKSSIIKLGVRVNPLSTDELTDFEKGRPLSVNADRTLKRGARRNLQRFKLRRENLIELLKNYKIIDDTTLLSEVGKNTTHQTLELRAKAAIDKIELEDFAKVLLTINKKRGYKSSRKSINEEDGVAIDGMAVAKELYEKDITPGQYVYSLLEADKKYIPEFYRSDLKAEFDKVWEFQKQFYSDKLTDELYNSLQDKNKTQTWAICQKPFDLVGIKLDGNAAEQKLKKYELRTQALTEKINLEHLAIVLQEINNNLNQSSGYLGKISDRSKVLFADKLTVGQYLYQQIKDNPHNSLKNQVFYRQDYLDEFEQLWETQAKFYPVLSKGLKEEIRDVIIFYQRKLKSQKHLITECQFEKHHKAIPKSSPLFQEFKIWQNINNLQFKRIKGNLDIFVDTENDSKFIIDDESKQLLFEELNLRGDLKENEVLKFLGLKPKEWKCNFDKIEGNRTNQALYNVYQKIAENEGYGFDWSTKSAIEIKKELKQILPDIGINAEILDFDANIEGLSFDKQLSYQLWHLLYSAEDDSKVNKEDQILYGNSSVALKKKLHSKFGFQPEYTKWLASIRLQQDYGSLSARAIRKIIPYLQNGNEFSEACSMAGYNHSNSLNKEDLENRILKDRLELLPKNSLRNPVVEKILNQLVNLTNQVIVTYGKPDEVRIELARELKKSATERKEAFSFITKRTKENEDLRKLITKEFGIPNPTKNDIVRYRLWEELAPLGYKTVFTNKYVPKEKLFSKEIDIEHIIPKALLFDDSFSNKTLAYKNINLKKDDRTAIDFIESDFNSDLENYKNRVESLYNRGNGISKGKFKKLLMSQKNLPDGFIERDLRNSQYIAKKAKAMLFEVFNTVISTTGSITDKLREDWDLINVMKELNLPKYKALGLTEIQERKDSKNIEVIKDWTKRNDHRHHAMDALTVAFTTHNHIQYLNHLNARKDESHKKHKNIITIENLITERNGNGKKKFVAPMDNFRSLAKEHIESILISFKAKNKVVTKNLNKTKLKGKGKFNSKIQLTPRGQLHKETVYGRSKRPMERPVKISKQISREQIENIVNPTIKIKVLDHLDKYRNDILVAFDTKTLKKDPLIYKGEPLKEVYCFEDIYTIRKEINPDNFKNLKAIDKVIDLKVKKVLEGRLNEYGGNAKEAFSNLDKKPIWLNEAKGISIKRVTISGVSNAEPLHEKRDHNGEVILGKNGKSIQNDFISTGNNHHVAIYKDANGKLQENVVSFFEAVERANQGLPIIDKDYMKHQGWEFLFTMKQNEMFVFPSDNFDPIHIDLLDKNNSQEISKHLFRVQKFTTKDYWFRHHLETTITNNLDFTYKRITNLKYLENVLKVRCDHLGQIALVGEY